MRFCAVMPLSYHIRYYIYYNLRETLYIMIPCSATTSLNWPKYTPYRTWHTSIGQRTSGWAVTNGSVESRNCAHCLHEGDMFEMTCSVAHITWHYPARHPSQKWRGPHLCRGPLWLKTYTFFFFFSLLWWYRIYSSV